MNKCFCREINEKSRTVEIPGNRDELKYSPTRHQGIFLSGEENDRVASCRRKRAFRLSARFFSRGDVSSIKRDPGLEAPIVSLGKCNVYRLPLIGVRGWWTPMKHGKDGNVRYTSAPQSSVYPMCITALVKIKLIKRNGLSKYARVSRDTR